VAQLVQKGEIMKCWNAQCFNLLSPKATSCPSCGWDRPDKQAAPHDPLRGRCSDVDRNGNRCAAPGALSESTRGSDTWFCHVHFPPFRSRGYKREAPPPDFFKSHNPARTAANIAEDEIERLAIQSEGS
jgi:hypothetical protein